MNKKLFQKRAKEALKAYSKEEIRDIDLNNPTIGMLEKIADMGEVSIDWLLGRDKKDIIKDTLNDSEIKAMVDNLSGKELKAFTKWSRNWMTGDTYTETVITNLYPKYRQGCQISKEEQELLELIYYRIASKVLCGE